MNNCVSHIGGQAGSILSNIADRKYTTVSVRLETDDLVISLPDYAWGHAELVFPKPQGLSQLSPIHNGNLYLVEGVYSEEDGYSFSFLINRENSDSYLDYRLLKASCWEDIGFTSKEPWARVQLKDYPAALEANGYSGYTLFSACCDQLVKKARILGSAFLGLKEKRLWNFAEFWRATGLIEDDYGTATYDEDFLKSLISNRYGFDQVISTAEELLFIPKCTQFLRNAAEVAELGGERLAFAWIFKFYKYVSRLIRENRLQCFGSRAAEAFKDASEEVNAVNCETGTFLQSAASAAVAEVLEPWLSIMGYTGSFPHYRRMKAVRGDFITVRQLPGETPDGIPCTFYLLEGARTHVSLHSGDIPVVDGAAFDSVRADDYYSSVSDTKYCRIRLAEVYSVQSEDRTSYSGLHLLPEYLRVIDKFLRFPIKSRKCSRLLITRRKNHSTFLSMAAGIVLAFLADVILV
jgi:hypothetical protein